MQNDHKDIPVFSEHLMLNNLKLKMGVGINSLCES